MWMFGGSQFAITPTCADHNIILTNIISLYMYTGLGKMPKKKKHLQAWYESLDKVSPDKHKRYSKKLAQYFPVHL